jgi:hypothetical protein
VRTRAIDYLRRKGHETSAERAEKLLYTLPPRHNGVLAAIESARDADVVLVAHSVLEDVGTLKELWGRIPFERAVTARYWRLASTEVPHDTDELIAFLYDWWERIDRWIAEREAAAKGV